MKYKNNRMKKKARFYGQQLEQPRSIGPRDPHQQIWLPLPPRGKENEYSSLQVITYLNISVLGYPL